MDCSAPQARRHGPSTGQRSFPAPEADARIEILAPPRTEAVRVERAYFPSPHVPSSLTDLPQARRGAAPPGGAEFTVPVANVIAAPRFLPT